MINGDVNEFIDGLYYGDERTFIYDNIKYFIQGHYENNSYILTLDSWDPPSDDYLFKKITYTDGYAVDEFLNAKIFNNKTFWEVESEIEWVDC